MIDNEDIQNVDFMTESRSLHGHKISSVLDDRQFLLNFYLR